MKSFESLASFATDDRIIRLVAKERGKYAAKSNGKGDAFKTDPLFQALKGMTPPHKLWSDPGRGKLPRRADRGIAKWTGKKRKAAINDIIQTILRGKVVDYSGIQLELCC